MRHYEFYIKPGAGECAQASLPLPASGRGLIAGTVTGEHGPEVDALVLLLEQERVDMVDYTFTDEQGRFWFGPVMEDTLYRVRVQKAGGAVRLVELQG